MGKTSNISRADFRSYLSAIGCKCIRTEGGHELWTRHDLKRPITLQTHVDPIPEFILKNCLRGLGIEKANFDVHDPASAAKK
ncbi:MAG TPA: type II toxin-antitoxin system HicA family toxin [Candidatus Kapabacteria bacterium]|nr:type II toxin-antitoxin system HicA family toxin [Candidatus Kapabacteria bacterium]